MLLDLGQALFFASFECNQVLESACRLALSCALSNASAIFLLKA